MDPREVKYDRLPPYVAYSTWQRLLDSLQPNLPAQLDRSFYDNLGFSGTQISTIKAALDFLGLASHNGVPREQLRRLVQVNGDKRKEIIRNIVQEAYFPLFAGINVRTATSGQLSDCFEKVHARGDIGRKCISFFLSIAQEAGIELSPHFFKRAKGIGRKKTAAKIREKERLQRKSNTPPGPAVKKPWEELLLEKFPNFDPTWPEPIKKAWFEDFQELQRMKYVD